ncbi:MAG TPA: GGDEF domain-containing protein [Micromonosporaceae bacterium]|nr:GGDEF domain-containing protein [Micromonosporaceae bacterium]
MEILHHTDRARVAAPADERAEAELARLRVQVARLQAERAALWWAIHHDELTGLANRRLLNTVGPALLRNGGRCAVLMLDLNRFKQINDRYGHAVGDEVLCTVAGRLSRCLVDDMVVRLSGDEFAAVLTESSLSEPHHDWPALVEAIAETVAQPMAVADNQLVVNASIGVATSDGGHDTLADLVRRADLAMYRAKSNRYRSYVAWD